MVTSRPPSDDNCNPTYSDYSDQDLMNRLRDGDDLALNAIMERWEKPVLNFITRYTNNRSDAVELAQETFVRIYLHRKRYRSKGRFSTWMFTIAVNLCRNHSRWKSRHPSVTMSPEDGTDLTNSLVSSEESPDAASIRHDEANLVRRAVQELPHDLRTAVLLFEFEGLSHVEIAAVLKCSTKAVETRLYRARKALKVTLQKILREKSEE